MHKPSKDTINEIVITEMTKWVVVSSNKKSRAQLDALSERLIRYFILFQIKRLPMTTMVSEIILRHLKGWNPKAKEQERLAELDELSLGLVRYFTEFEAEPEPEPVTLPGLPGGAPLG